MTARRALIAAVAAALMAAAPAGGVAANAIPATAGASRIEQMVVFRSGDARRASVSTRAALVRVGRRRCVAGDRTPLAALVRSRAGRLHVRDFGACSRRARDGGGLFVAAIGPDRNRGQNGWVYKVGRRGATAGAADPSGPFGRGRLKASQRVTWFFCRLVNGGCQRTLEVRAAPEPGGVVATVRGYDDDGRGVAIEGATVSTGGATGTTAADGTVRLALTPGAHRLVAEKPGLVRSFAERVEVP